MFPSGFYPAFLDFRIDKLSFKNIKSYIQSIILVILKKLKKKNH